MSVYQHFRQEEHEFIDQVLSWKTSVEKTYRVIVTDFLDPREQFIVQSLIGPFNDLQVEFNGGSEQCERKRAVIAPFYEVINADRFQLAVLEATFPKKFVSIEHRDVMGAFLSLGLVREKLGDIIVHDDLIQMVVAEEIASYVMLHLDGIKKARVTWQQKDLTDLKIQPIYWEKRECIVSSLRLDAVLKEIYRLSRNKAVQMIEQQRVKVNFKVVDQKAYVLYEGDLISLRGFGRSKIDKVHKGRTRKDKLRLSVGLLK